MNFRARQRVAVLVTFGLLAPASLLAQSTTAPGADAPIHLGRFAVSPTVTVETGHETNVINSPTDPQPDTFVSVLPALQATFNLSRMKVDATASAPYVHYRKFTDRGQTGADAKLGFELPFSRLTFKASGGYQNLKQRLNLELDQPTHRISKIGAGGVEVQLTPHMAVEAGAQRQIQDYGDTTLTGVDVASALSEKQDAVSVTVKRAVTPLSDVIALFEVRRDRFDTSSLRNTDSRRVMVGLQSTALLNGRATVGYASFSPLDAAIPKFKGLVVDASLDYPFFGTTLVSIEASRDVTFSYSDVSPYFVASTGSLSVTQPIAFELVVRASASLQRSDYKSIAGSGAPDETERGTSYSLGLGRKLGQHLTVGALASQTERRGGVLRPSYTDWRLGATLAFAF